MSGGGFSAGARWRGWARRYLVAEVAGFAGAVLPALAVSSGNRVLVAVVATAGEAVAFYGVFAIVQVARVSSASGGFWRRFRGEFGPAGAVNTVIVRPVAIYFALSLLDGVVAGVIVGKLLADAAFLGVTVLSYELARRRAGSPDDPSGDATDPGDPVPDPVGATPDPAETAAAEPVDREAVGVAAVGVAAAGAEAAGAAPAVPVSAVFDAGDPFDAGRFPSPPSAPAAPYLTIDLGRVTNAYSALMTALPGVTLAYPVAANAAPDLLRHVGTLGARFVARSLADVRTLARLGVRAADLRLDTTVLPWWHVRDMHALGVWRFRVDSTVELAKTARYAPGAAVVVPVAVDAGRAAGVDADQAYALLVEARALGLRPWGVSCEISEAAIATCAIVMNRLGLLGVTLSSVDLGEGATVDTAPAVMGALRRHLPYPLTVAASVGRALVAEAGTVTATVTGLAWRSGERWIHLDVGARTGGVALDPDGVALPLAMSDARGGEAVPYRVTGPVGDPADGLGAATLSADLAVGDEVRLHGAGAYTVSNASPAGGYPVPTTVCTLRGADRAPADAWADWADWTEWEPEGIARGGLAGLAATLAGAKVATDATTGGWRRRAATEPKAPPPAPKPREAVPDTGSRRALRRSRQPDTITIPENEELFIPIGPTG